MPYIDASDGTALFYSEWGEGEPILFLSSLGCGQRLWDYQVVAFAEAGFRCVGIDRRGHGRSDQSKGGYDYDTFADDIATLIERLDLSSLTMIAHSMAGGEIVRYLSRHGPSRVARIVFVAPTTPKLLSGEDNPGGVPRAGFEALWAQWRRDYPKWIDDAVAPFLIPETSRPMMRWAGGLLQASLPVTLACSRAMAEEDFRDEMRRIDIPALIIHGDRDRSMPLEITGRPSIELLRNGRLLIYEGGPHGLMFTHMDRLQADIVGFIREA